MKNLKLMALGSAILTLLSLTGCQQGGFTSTQTSNVPGKTQINEEKHPSAEEKMVTKEDCKEYITCPEDQTRAAIQNKADTELQGLQTGYDQLIKVSTVPDSTTETATTTAVAPATSTEPKGATATSPTPTTESKTTTITTPGVTVPPTTVSPNTSAALDELNAAIKVAADDVADLKKASTEIFPDKLREVETTLNKAKQHLTKCRGLLNLELGLNLEADVNAAVEPSKKMPPLDTFKNDAVTLTASVNAMLKNEKLSADAKLLLEKLKVRLDILADLIDLQAKAVAEAGVSLPVDFEAQLSSALSKCQNALLELHAKIAAELGNEAATNLVVNAATKSNLLNIVLPSANVDVNSAAQVTGTTGNPEKLNISESSSGTLTILPATKTTSDTTTAPVLDVNAEVNGAVDATGKTINTTVDATGNIIAPAVEPVVDITGNVTGAIGL